MKQFIYLDTDIINSIIAQKEKGLVLEIASEHEDTAGNEKSKAGSITLDGSVGGGMVFGNLLRHKRNSVARAI